MRTKHLSRRFELRSADEKTGTFTGYGSVFDVEDAYGDVVIKGAFANSLDAWKAKGDLPALLWQHDARVPIGKWTKMAEDDHGLLVEGQIFTDVAAGGDAYKLLSRGAIKGLSIGFSIAPGGYEYDKGRDAYLLKQIDLWEVSLVTFPANEEAQVETVKGALHSPKNLERFLREAGLPRSVAKAVVAGGYDRTADLREADAASGTDEAKQKLRTALAALGR